MACKDICRTMKIPHTFGHPKYRNGNVWCKTCNVTFKYEGLYCPCCGYRIRRERRMHRVRRVGYVEVAG